MGIILRQNKGSELTFAEVDGNFQSLYYSSSLAGSTLEFFFASSSISHSIDLNNVPGFTGVTIESGSATISSGVQTLNFLGSGIASVTDAGNNQVDINISGGGGGSGTGIFQLKSGTDIFFTTSSLQVTASTYQSSSYAGTGVTINPNNDGTGGSVNKYGMMLSQSIWHYTDNVGYPTSKAWKTDLDGSVFDRYDANTDTAEIIRFIATQLSESSPDTSPNARTYSNISEDISNNGTGTPVEGTVPNSSTNATIIYLISKGFATAGDPLFKSITPIYNNSSYNIKYDSVAAGSTTTPSSSNDPSFQLFGLGAVSSSFTVSGSRTMRFADNSAKTNTATSGSEHTLTKTPPPFNTTDGLTIGAIPTVGGLPITFQDGKFVGVFQQGLYNNGVTLSTKEATGYYQISASIAIKSGSSALSGFKSAEEEIFYAPLSTINGALPTSVPAIGYFGSRSYGTATSMSLSGAPYLKTNSYLISSSIENAFDPLFNENSTFASITDGSSLVTLSDGGTGVKAGSTLGGTVQTANFIYTSGIADAPGSIPKESSTVQLTASAAFSAGSGGSTNIQEDSLSPTNFSITTNCKDSAGNTDTPGSSNMQFHKPGEMGQTLASGSLAYYGRAQGYDGGSLTGTTAFSEQFTGETYRLTLNDKVLTGSYASADNEQESAFTLEQYKGVKDLQVKPGFLVEPGNDYAYWIPANPSANAYKYYARAFQRNLGTGAGSITASFGKALNTWDSTSDGVSVAFLFSGSGAQAYSVPRIFDPATTVGDALEVNIANDNFKNPFGDPIDLYAAKTGTINGSGASTEYRFPLLNGNGMILDDTKQDFIVIIRYKGDPSPISNISITIA